MVALARTSSQNLRRFLSSFHAFTQPTHLNRPIRRSCTSRHNRRWEFAEALETRALLSTTLFVTSPATPQDATHFQTLQAALSAASSGDTIDLQAGFSTGSVATAVVISTPVTLTSDPGVTVPFSLRIAAGVSGVTLSGLTMAAGTSLLMDGTGNTVMNCTLPRVVLDSGSNTNTFTQDTIAGLTSQGGGNSNGHDTFNQNTFTGRVAITGNDSAATDDSFTGNTFTVSNATTALDLEKAGGTSVTNNTITDSMASANVVMVHNSTGVLITNNQITGTGGQSHGLYIFADGTGSASAQVSGNTIVTTDGVAIYLSKMATTAALEVSVQGNTLQNNAIGVYIFGDGSSGGNIDLGGGSTDFGASAGGNDFSGFTTSDASHFAIGIFSTTGDYAVNASGDIWGVNNPLSVVADTNDTLDASGSGQVIAGSPTIVLPTPPTPPTPPITPTPTPSPTETITETVRNFTLVQGQHLCGSVAHFTDNVKHRPGDFTATITWADGTTSKGIVVRDGNGFDVLAGHGTLPSGNFTVAITSNTGATQTGTGSITVTPRLLTASSSNLSLAAGANFCGTVATFTDNLPCCSPCGYTVTITWSDGTTSRALVVRNHDGSYSVVTSRTFGAAGTVTGTVSIATRDGNFSATTSFTVTLTAPPTSNSSGSHGSTSSGTQQGRTGQTTCHH